jgi:hypothetical protein
MTTGEARGNLSTTPGAVDGVVIVDFSPAFVARCKVLNVTAVCALAAAPTATHSDHQGCLATFRSRGDAELVVTGGSGAFAGATGCGVEINQTHNGEDFF